MNAHTTILRFAVSVCLVLSCTFLNAQNGRELQHVPLVIKLAAICDKITSYENDPALLMRSLFGDSVRLSKNESQFTGFSGDSAFVFFNGGAPVALDRYYDTTQKRIRLFHVYTDPDAHYTINKNKQVVFDNPDAADNISYPELKAYFGAVVSDFPSGMQPKDTKYYHFIYTNPRTQNKAVVKITSFDPPASNYNIIYRISIYSFALDPPFDYSILKKSKPVVPAKKRGA